MRSSGIPTGYGEYLAIREACDFMYGSRDLSERTIAIQGLGEVGSALAENLLHESAHLFVTDIDVSKAHKLQEKHGRDLVHYVEPESIYTVDADVFSPCAMGGVITEERIPLFRYKIIMGAANNQLQATSKEGEIKLARKLADAGILFVVDWAHNTGGVIRAWAEWVFQEEATFDKIKPRIELVCKDNLRKLLEEAKETGKTPTELVYEKVEEMVYSGAGFSEAL